MTEIPSLSGTTSFGFLLPSNFNPVTIILPSWSLLCFVVCTLYPRTGIRPESIKPDSNPMPDTNNSFFLTQKVTNFGYNPPQINEQTLQTKIANEQERGNHSFTMDCEQERSGNNVLKKGSFDSGTEKSSFWTVCPYCYYMYEYEIKYEDCCLLGQHCKRGFHGSAVAPPPESMFAVGKEAEHYCGYGFFPLGHCGGSFLGDKKKGFEGDNEKNYDVVEISDYSDDEKEEMDLKKEVVEVKEPVGKGGCGMERVKSVPKNAKKVMGRGIKGKMFEKLNIREMKVEIENQVGEDASGSGFQDGCDEDEFEFFEGEDDIFVSLKYF